MQEIKGIIMDLARDVAAAIEKIQIAGYLLYFFSSSFVNFHVRVRILGRAERDFNNE
jgi:hypothetical protein